MKVSAAVATALVASAWAAAPAPALDEGVPDFDGHPNVGLMGFDVDGPGPEPTVAWCSGSVISDRVFLTAAHCLVGFPAGTAFAVTLDAGAPATPVYKPGRIFDDFPNSFTAAAPFARKAITHPQFGTPVPNAHDVAVLVFAPATFAGVTPVRLPRPGEFDRHRHNAFALVGYGGDPEWGDGDPPVVIGEGYRQRTSAPLKRLTPTQLLLDGRTRVTGRGTTCLGDSGGPQLFPGTNVALSLLSGEPEDCNGTIVGQRLDTSSERRFLSAYLG